MISEWRAGRQLHGGDEEDHNPFAEDPFAGLSAEEQEEVNADL
jgi:hypothetical protein